MVAVVFLGALPARAATVIVYPDLFFDFGKGVSPGIITPSVTGIPTRDSLTISPSLSANTGLSFNKTTGAISGIPTSGSAATLYTVTAWKFGLPDGGVATFTVTVTGFTYGSPAVVCTKGTPIATNSPANITGSGGTYSANPALPAGLTLNPSTGAITGTPTVQGALVKHAITRNFTGSAAVDTVRITVNDTAPATLGYWQSSLRGTRGAGIVMNRPTVTGGAAGLSYALQSGTLPPGLSLSASTGNIWGAPSAAGDFFPVIRVSNSGGFADAALSYSVRDTQPAFSYIPASVSYPIRQTVTPLLPSHTGGAALAWSIAPDLTANTGLSFNSTTGAIVGTPVYATAATPYTVTATGFGGSQGQTVVTIATTAAAPTVAYPDAAQVWSMNAPASLAKTGATGAITHYSVSPPLPAGLLLNATTGAVSGVPSSPTAAADYTITAHGPGGAGNDVVNIAITSVPPTVSCTNAPQSWPVGTAVTLSKLGATGIISSYSISPALPEGLRFNATTARIEGAPAQVTAAADYVIAAHGPGGTGRDTVNIATPGTPPSILFAQDTVRFVLRQEITPFRPANSGGAIARWSIGTGSNGGSLVANTGLQFNTTTGRIQGTPVYLSEDFGYTVVAHGIGGTADSARIAIGVTAPLGKAGVGTSLSPFDISGRRLHR